jgi:IS30 family transposase
MIEMFLNMLNMRFPNFELQAYKDNIFSAAEDQLNRYSAKLFTAKTPEEVFADDEQNTGGRLNLLPKQRS